MVATAPEDAGVVAPVGRVRGAAAGVLAAAAATAAGELAGQVVPGGDSPLLAVSDRTIGLATPGLRDAAVGTLGTADKPVLVAGVVLTVLALGAFAGLRGRRQISSAYTLIAVLAAFAGVCVAAGPKGTAVGAAVVSVALGLVGACALRLLLLPGAAPVSPLASRRLFLLRGGALAALTLLAGGASRALATRVDVERLRSLLRLPAPVRPAPGDIAAGTLPVRGISPLLTPNGAFYRIDTALSVPRVDSRTWTLQVKGMVDRPLTLSYADLLAMRQYEADITLQCVSNEVGGDLVGNARWQGVLLSDLLAMVGVQAGADQLVGRSVDNFTAGFPTSVAIDGRPAMVAVGMNGEPLPQDHGFPARLVVPGLYGYVSATKWLASIELTTLEGFDGFWIPRGWAKLAPIKVASRIDVPATFTRLTAGPVVVAGVAWAPGPRRGVVRVEVRVDEGRWQDADLAGALSQDAWRQWRWRWDATPGEHLLEVRATDRTGAVQDGRRRPQRPDGATGYHGVLVRAD